MPRKKQLSLDLGKLPTKRKSRKKFHRPRKGDPQCQNLLRKRIVVANKYVWLNNVECVHKGREYAVNGIRIVLCVCCARRLMRKSGCVPKETKYGGAAPSVP
jgi:hypothetical protein